MSKTDPVTKMVVTIPIGTKEFTLPVWCDKRVVMRMKIHLPGNMTKEQTIDYILNLAGSHLKDVFIYRTKPIQDVEL